ncbi:hypothetical protein HXP44_12400 [Streptomyces sioyaensis]|nr:hypothetical protein [Streptomyces sioyaensis]
MISDLPPSAHQQVTPAEPFPLARLTQHPADFDESRFAGQPHEVVDRPPVGRRHFVVERRNGLTFRLEEGEQEVAVRREHPPELA